MDSCDIKPRRYDRPFEEYRQAARNVAGILKKEIETSGSVTWERVMQAADRDEVIYKLTLKYLRQDGYDIGNNKQPYVRRS
jgi:hypothetical protein